MILICFSQYPVCFYFRENSQLIIDIQTLPIIHEHTSKRIRRPFSSVCTLRLMHCISHRHPTQLLTRIIRIINDAHPASQTNAPPSLSCDDDPQSYRSHLAASKIHCAGILQATFVEWFAQSHEGLQIPLTLLVLQ